MARLEYRSERNELLPIKTDDIASLFDTMASGEQALTGLVYGKSVNLTELALTCYFDTM